MLYLAGSTRTDITYDIHECRRFSHSPKRSHEIGVKNNTRYLKVTKTKGIIMTPNKDNARIDIYAAAEFTGLYTTEDKINPVSVKCRIGVLLTFGNEPFYGAPSFSLRLLCPR